MWKTIASSGATVDKVMPTLLSVLEDWPVHKIYTSDGDNKDVFSLAVSFWNWPLLAPRLPLQLLSILSPTAMHLPVSGTGLTPSGLGAGSGAPGQMLPLHLPLALPVGTERCLWVLCPLQATRVVWEMLRLPWCPEPFMEYSPHLLVALLFQVFISTEEVPEEVNTFWRRCQAENGLPTSINRCSIPVLLSLPRPQG